MYLQQPNICHRIDKYRLKNCVIYFLIIYILYLLVHLSTRISHLRVCVCMCVCVCVCEYFTGLSKHLLSISIFSEMSLSWIR